MASSPPRPSVADRMDSAIAILFRVNQIVLLGMMTFATAILSPVVVWKLAHGHSVDPMLAGGSGITAMGAVVGVLAQGALSAARQVRSDRSPPEPGP